MWYKRVKKTDPPTPEEIRVSGRNLILKNEKEMYTEFVFRMIPYVVGKNVWNNNATNTRLSCFVTPSLEAFAMLIYDNGYKPWMWDCQQMAALPATTSSDEEDALTTSIRPAFKYTHRTQDNMVRNGGWSEEGHDYCDMCYDEIGIRRKKQASTKFDEAFRKTCTERILVRKKRKVSLNPDGTENRRVRRHDLDLLNL